MKTTKHPLSPPSLEELAKVLQPALAANYEQATVTVVDCPDLRKAPFHLAARGLSGDERAADIGGQPHLFPRPRLDKKYSMLDCARAMEMHADQGMFIGAGAGPFHVLGRNSELAPNLSWKDGFDQVDNSTHYAMIDDSTEVVCKPCPSNDCALMMNLYGSRGDSGLVLQVNAAKRTGDQKSFTECIRQALTKAYGDKRDVSMGGVFVVKKGKALFHVMPDFPPESELPWTERQQLMKWLTFHKFGSPMVCLTVFDSADPEKLGLRMEHTHAFSGDGKSEGGHYHYDLPADQDGTEEIEYEGYFNTAKLLYRIDQPDVR